MKNESLSFNINNLKKSKKRSSRNLFDKISEEKPKWFSSAGTLKFSNRKRYTKYRNEYNWSAFRIMMFDL